MPPRRSSQLAPSEEERSDFFRALRCSHQVIRTTSPRKCLAARRTGVNYLQTSPAQGLTDLFGLALLSHDLPAKTYTSRSTSSATPQMKLTIWLCWAWSIAASGLSDAAQ